MLAVKTAHYPYSQIFRNAQKEKRGFLEGAAAEGYSDELSPVEERLTCRTKVTQTAARAKAKGKLR